MGTTDQRRSRRECRVTIIRAAAPAKINLGLEVIGRRQDGFHEIATIFQSIDLYDSISVSSAEQLILEVDEPDLQDETNLALTAAKSLQARFSISRGAHIQLHKEIPAAAGLGGA